MITPPPAVGLFVGQDDGAFRCTLARELPSELVGRVERLPVFDSFPEPDIRKGGVQGPDVDGGDSGSCVAHDLAGSM